MSATAFTRSEFVIEFLRGDGRALATPEYVGYTGEPMSGLTFARRYNTQRAANAAIQDAPWRGVRPCRVRRIEITETLVEV